MSQNAIDAAEFDDTDIELLQAIEDNFDVSLDTLASKIELSQSAIHYRLNKLRENGVIEGVTADLNPVHFGLSMVAITEVSVTHEHGYSENIGTKLAALDGVEQVYYTMGDVDFVCILRVQNRNQMSEVIEDMVAIAGVNETSSRFVMDEISTSPKLMANLSDNMRTSLTDRE